MNTKSDVVTIVADSIRGFLFWNIYGRPSHGKQYFYDPYHKAVSFHPKDNSNGVFVFSIQVSDSPEGDTWLSGEVKVHGRVIDWDTLSYKVES